MKNNYLKELIILKYIELTKAEKKQLIFCWHMKAAEKRSQ